jgi:hypothetical protein
VTPLISHLTARIQRVDPIVRGKITEYPIPTGTSNPTGITQGPDGNLWFTENRVNQIGKLTPSGTFTEYKLPCQHPCQRRPWKSPLALMVTSGLPREPASRSVASALMAPSPHSLPLVLPMGSLQAVFDHHSGALPHIDIGGEFKKWGKIAQKRPFFLSRWGIPIAFGA